MDIQLLEHVIHAGAKIAFSHFGKIEALADKEISEHHDKADWGKSALSQADIATQIAIMKEILQSGIEMGIICEESNDIIKDLEKKFTHKNTFVENNLTLVIDPIDGTGNYVSATKGHPKHESNKHNHKHWGVSGAIFDGDECVMGVIEYPALNLTLITQKGKGTTINGKRITVKPRLFSEQSVVRVSSSMQDRHIKELFPRQQNDVRSLVARLLGYLGFEGVPQADAYIGEYVPIYDLACAPLAYKEAGGFVIDQQGKDCNPFCEIVEEVRQKQRFFFVPTREFGFSLLAFMQ